MIGQSTRRWLQLSFLLMASTASAGSLKLTDFESIGDKSFPSTCVAAYDTPLSDCTPDDFTGGKACSAACKDSVQQIQGLIMASCGDVSADSESLLSRGQKGNLVAVLCRNADESQSQSEAQSQAKSESKSEPQSVSESETQASATTTTGSASATKVHKNILIETSVSTTTTSKENLNGAPLSDVDENLATKSTVLAIDTEQPTGSLPLPKAPTQVFTSVTRSSAPSQTAEAAIEEPTPTPTTAGGAVHAPSFNFMCASFAMSALMYMVVN
uniref:Extracellular membrane protein CFEM domain-containing protein n=1 Tax=Gibberella zeae TaxID=5518 RepID=A0A4E9D6N1_GIBZA